MNCRQHSAIAPEFNPVNHVKDEPETAAPNPWGKLTQYFDLAVAHPSKGTILELFSPISWHVCYSLSVLGVWVYRYLFSSAALGPVRQDAMRDA